MANFITLAEKGFYDGLIFHRVLPGFMAQGGDPKSDGTGGPGYEIPAEFRKPNHRLHFRGSLSMARAQDPDSAGSQFFLMFAPNGDLDGNYTVFGRMTKGFDVLAKIAHFDPQSAGTAAQARQNRRGQGPAQASARVRGEEDGGVVCVSTDPRHLFP